MIFFRFVGFQKACQIIEIDRDRAFSEKSVGGFRKDNFCELDALKVHEPNFDLVGVELEFSLINRGFDPIKNFIGLVRIERNLPVGVQLGVFENGYF
jgi:hypothetical protein